MSRCQEKASRPSKMANASVNSGTVERASDPRAAVVEAGVAAEMEGVAASGRVHHPAARESRHEGTIGRELGQVVEEEGHDLAGRHVGRVGRIQGAGIVREVVLEAAARRARTACCERQEQRKGGGEAPGEWRYRGDLEAHRNPWERGPFKTLTPPRKAVKIQGLAGVVNDAGHPVCGSHQPRTRHWSVVFLSRSDEHS